MPAPSLCIAAGKVTGSSGAASKCVGATPARTSAGVYTLTLSQEVDATECHVSVTPVGTADVRVAVSHTSDSVKTISTFSGAVGTAADSDFTFQINQFSFAS